MSKIGSGLRKVARNAPLVGRDQEFSLLQDRLNAASRGEGGVFLVSGEPGMGKSRLLTEIGAHATQNGWTVLAGRAYDTFDMPPYLPFASALTGYLQRAHDDEITDQLAKMAPELSLYFPSLNQFTTNAVSTPNSAPEVDRFRLFEGLSETFLQISRKSEAIGLLLCLDDLHWADSSTLLLFQHLSRKLATERLLVLATYRSQTVERAPALLSVLSDLTRERLADRITLNSLSLDETAAFVEALNRDAPSAAVSEAIYQKTEGNPFFIEETVRHLSSVGLDLNTAGLAESEIGVSEEVREVVAFRLSRLSPHARCLLEASTVLGQHGEPTFLQEVSQLPSALAAEALEETVASGLLRQEEAGYFCGHPLIRQVIYERINILRRQELHLRAGEAVASAYPAGNPLYRSRLAYIATQFRLAGPSAEADKTADLCIQAADAAKAVFSWAEAVAHYEAALGALERSGHPEARRCDVLIGLCTALLPAEFGERVLREIAPAAYELAEALHDRQRKGAISVAAVDAIGRIWGGTGFGSPEARQWLRRADVDIEAGTTERILVDVRLAGLLMLSGQRREGNALQMRAYEDAKRIGNREALFVAAGFGPLNFPPISALPDMVRVNSEMAQEDRAGVSPRALARFLSGSSQAFLLNSDRRGFETRTRELGQLSSDSKEAFIEGLAVEALAYEAILDGRLHEALAVLRASNPGVPFHSFIQHLLSAQVLLLLGESEQAANEFSSAPPLFEGMWQPLGASVMARLGEKQAAARELKEWLKQVGPSPEAHVFELTWALDAAISVEDRNLVRELCENMNGFQPLAFGGRLAPVAPARLVGMGWQLLGDHMRARKCYEDALRALLRLEYRPEMALTSLALGELLLRNHLRERTQALEHLDGAIDELESMGMRPALEHALSIRQTTTLTGHGQNEVSSGLSSRELEVLRLLAAGKSNQQIADELVISLSTVLHHVTNILTKTGCSNRTEAAAYAHHRGLS